MDRGRERVKREKGGKREKGEGERERREKKAERAVSQQKGEKRSVGDYRIKKHRVTNLLALSL